MYVSYSFATFPILIPFFEEIQVEMRTSLPCLSLQHCSEVNKYVCNTSVLDLLAHDDAPCSEQPARDVGCVAVTATVFRDCVCC